MLQRQGWLQAMPLVPRCNLVLPAASINGPSSVQPDVLPLQRSTTRPPPQPQPVVLQRGLTSAAWPAAALERCAYAQLPRADPSRPLYEFELYSSCELLGGLVRWLHCCRAAPPLQQCLCVQPSAGASFGKLAGGEAPPQPWQQHDLSAHRPTHT